MDPLFFMPQMVSLTSLLGVKLKEVMTRGGKGSDRRQRKRDNRTGKREKGGIPSQIDRSTARKHRGLTYPKQRG